MTSFDKKDISSRTTRTKTSFSVPISTVSRAVRKPTAEYTTVYLPESRFAIRNLPSTSDAAPTFSSCITTLTPGSGAPVESMMMPTRSAVWANALCPATDRMKIRSVAKPVFEIVVLEKQ